jgi:hypothetical protein
MNPIRTKTPKSISAHLLPLCARVSNSEPVYVDVAPFPGALPNECFENVRIQTEKYGGDIVHGWSIAEWPGVYAEAQFHAVWRSPDQKLLCVTPSIEGEVRILFLPDSSRRYEGFQVDNVRIPLIDNHYVREFIAEAERMHRVMNRGDRAFSREVAIPREELFPIVKRMNDLMKRMERLEQK